MFVNGVIKKIEIILIFLFL